MKMLTQGEVNTVARVLQNMKDSVSRSVRDKRCQTGSGICLHIKIGCRIDLRTVFHLAHNDLAIHRQIHVMPVSYTHLDVSVLCWG